MTHRRTIFSLLIVVAGLIGCTTATETNITVSDEPMVEPLRDHYDLLMKEAQLWRKDAYLDWVSFSFEAGDKEILAAFQSPSTDDESFSITYSPLSDSISKETYQHEYPIQTHVPIEESDWKIDSTDAMNYFLSYDDIQNSWRMSPQWCNDLQLRHFFVDEKWVLAWVLSIFDCRSSIEYFYLDPISGERLDLVY